jgi:Ca2+/Na+ antiporter
MTDQPPPTLSYQASAKTTPNFGMRAAMISWLAPLAALLLFATVAAIGLTHAVPDLMSTIAYIVGGLGAMVWIIGLVSGIAALVTIRRYGRKGILRPAIIGLCLSLLVLLLMLGFIAYALIEAGAAAAR